MSGPLPSFPMPALLPKELSYLGNVSSEEALLTLLIKKPQDFILFFEYACGDETWSETHSGFMQKAINWFTIQSFQENLFVEFSKRAAKAIQEHYPVLSPFIPLDIVFKLKDSSAEINSLLFASASSFFKDILRRECFEKNKTELSLDISAVLFRPIEEFVNTGTIAHLWKHEQKEVVALLRLSASWGLQEVVKLCEETLQRYITKENAIDMLLMAHHELWPGFKQDCMNYINSLNEGFSLSPSPGESLHFEFLDFGESALKNFERLRPWITTLICSGDLTEDPHFSEVVQRCPNMRSLNISGSSSFSDMLFDIPGNLQALNLSQCLWLNAQTLKKMAEICPHLQKIILASNVQLHSPAWGEISKFRQLTFLDLSRCHQITNDDFLIILKACYHVTELILDGCNKIEDKGFFTLARSLNRIVYLDLSRCSLTDTALVEIATRCHSLTSLNLTRCENITEKGILGLAKHANLLKELNLTRCHVPLVAIEELKKQKPYLILIT